MLMMKKMFVLIFMMVMCGGTQKIVCAEKKLIDCDSLEVFNLLVKKSDEFHTTKCSFPTNDNRIEVIAGDDENIKRRIGEGAKSVRVLMHPKVPAFLNKYLQYKKIHGTNLEKSLYANLNLNGFIYRLLHNRPLALYTELDKYMLVKENANDKHIEGYKDFHEKNMIEWNGKYLSEDEINLSSLIEICGHDQFINNLGRYSRGLKTHFLDHVNYGIHIAAVGTCYEKKRNAVNLTIGVKPFEDGEIEKMWLDLLGETSLDQSEERIKNKDRYIRTSKWISELKSNREEILDMTMYKNYMELILDPLLVEANARGKMVGKKSYIRLVGLGLGVWALQSDIQAQLILEVCEKILTEKKFLNISVIECVWFPKKTYNIKNCSIEWSDVEGDYISEKINFGNNEIVISFSKNNFASLLPKDNVDDLLVVTTAWDGGSKLGNEYWVGLTTATGDAAAGANTTGSTTQNTDINPCIYENVMKMQFPEISEAANEENTKKLDFDKAEQKKLENQKKLDEQKKLDLENQEKIDAQKKLEDQQNFDKELGGILQGWANAGFIELLSENNNDEEERKDNLNIENEKKEEELKNTKKFNENEAFIKEQWQKSQLVQKNLNKQLNNINGTGIENNNKQDDRSMIAKFFTCFKTGLRTVAPVVGIGAILAAIYYFCTAHGIGTGMVFGH